MDTWSHVSVSSHSFGDSSSSAGSIAPPAGTVDSESSDEVSSRAPQDIRAELSGLKLVLISHKYTLVERSNQLTRMTGELDSKDHQLALMNRQVQLQDRRIAELEVQLVDVHNGQMQEASGMHASIRLLVDIEKECRQLHKRCQFWRSRALAKPNLSGDASRD
jgi:chromosome segregation ATPase